MSKKYKQYLRNSNAPIPRSTAWTWKSPQTGTVSEAAEAATVPPCTVKQRKLYNVTPSVPIPRQTLWFWKKKDECETTSLENQQSNDMPSSSDQSSSETESGPQNYPTQSDVENDDAESSGGSGMDDLQSYATHDGMEFESSDDNDEDCNGYRCNTSRCTMDELEDEADDQMRHMHYTSTEDSDHSTSDGDDELRQVDFGAQLIRRLETDQESEDTDDDCDSDEADNSSIMRKPLYDGALISTNTSWHSIMYFAISNKLSYKAIEDLIGLIDVHCPTPNQCPSKLYQLKKYFASLINQCVQQYCSACLKQLPNGKCQNSTCVRSKAPVCDLVVFSIEDSLKRLFEKHDKFQYPWKRIRQRDSMRDIHDGNVMSGLMEENGFLSSPGNTGLVLCTDGVPIFKSTKGSLWPVYLMVTSIPPHLRMKADNLIVAALWYGPIKPTMDILLRPIFDSIQHIAEVGVRCTEGNICHVKLLMGIFDLPAKACATNTKQFNGEYGCIYCFHKGERFRGARIYPPMGVLCQLKTGELMVMLASKAEELGEPQFGVKGRSILSEQIELPACIPIDYMHSILEGVFKLLMKYWFDSRYHSEPFSLRKHSHSINKMILKIRPPVEIPRIPRSLDAVSFYKASEFRAWLLFYSLPIFSKFLHPEYTHHYSLLVTAMYILLSDDINKDDLDVANQLLTCFHDIAGDLYTNSIYTANMHSLLHMVDFVRLWGPLWAYSMFGFENMNGCLGGTYHGTKRVVLQMSFQLQLHQSLPSKLEELIKNETPSNQEYIRRLLNKKRSNMMPIGDECYAVGRINLCVLSSHEESILLQAGVIVTDKKIQKFSRLMLRGIHYSTQSYSQKLSRDNSTCSYISAEGVKKYGTILTFFLSTAHTPFCFIQSYKILNNSPISEIRPTRNARIRQLNLDHLVNRYFVNVVIDCATAIPISCIQAKCCFVKIMNTEYIIQLPNPFEIH